MTVGALVELLMQYDEHLPIFYEGGLVVNDAVLEEDLFNEETKRQDKKAVILKS